MVKSSSAFLLLVVCLMVASCHADGLRSSTPRTKSFLSSAWDFVFGPPPTLPKWPLPSDASYILVSSGIHHQPGDHGTDFNLDDTNIVISSQKFGMIQMSNSDSIASPSGTYIKDGMSYEFNSEAGLCAPTFYSEETINSMELSAENFDACPEQPDDYDAFQFNKRAMSGYDASFMVFFKKGTAELDHFLFTVSSGGHTETIGHARAIYFSTEVPELPWGLSDAIKPCQPYRRSDAGVQGPWQATLKSDKSGIIVTVDSDVIDGKRKIRYDAKNSDGSTREAAIFVYDARGELATDDESYSYNSVLGPGCQEPDRDDVLSEIDVKFFQHDRLPLMAEHEGRKEYGHEKFVKRLISSVVSTDPSSLWEISTESKLAIAGKSVVYDAETKNPVEFKISCTQKELENGLECRKETFNVTKFVRGAPDASVFEPPVEWGCDREGQSAVPTKGFSRGHNPGPFGMLV